MSKQSTTSERRVIRAIWRAGITVVVVLSIALTGTSVSAGTMNLSPTSASAASATLWSGTIKGESTDDKHKDWIEVLA
jgi:major membrane immunogen (membrane-anchored lipoprotein)